VERALREASVRGAEALSLEARDLTEEDRACLRRDAEAKFLDVLREQARLVLAR